MSKRIWKLTALVLALLLALTGCSLIEIDQEMDNAEAVAIIPFLLLCGYMIYASMKKEK